MEYCLELENKLRPVCGIGYNVAIGGGEVSRLGATHTKETKQKMSESAKQRGQRPPQSALDKSAETNSKKVAWLCQFSNKDVWKRAGEVYDHLQKHPTHGTHRTSKMIGTTPDQLTQMFKKIKSGWNPWLDDEWLIFSGNLIPEISGDKSFETASLAN